MPTDAIGAVPAVDDQLDEAGLDANLPAIDKVEVRRGHMEWGVGNVQAPASRKRPPRHHNAQGTQLALRQQGVVL